jgi:hypothetical protein
MKVLCESYPMWASSFRVTAPVVRLDVPEVVLPTLEHTKSLIVGSSLSSMCNAVRRRGVAWQTRSSQL